MGVRMAFERADRLAAYLQFPFINPHVKIRGPPPGVGIQFGRVFFRGSSQADAGRRGATFRAL
jgi:hypothetical protein